jgi:ribosomal protein S12 methylthiotransferase
VRELLVISQDTSAHGADLRYRPEPWGSREIRSRFIDLARELGELGPWVRLHYVYPYPHVDEVIPLMAAGKVLARIRRWREQLPLLTIRSTFMVGFPGETEEDFRVLLEWLEAAELDRVGCFRYSPVDGAAATARSDAAAPEIDGVVRIRGRGAAALPVGEFAEVVITAASEYDLEARVA